MKQEGKEHEESIDNLLVSLKKGKTANQVQATGVPVGGVSMVCPGNT
jgi:hypothetical protein